MSLISVSISLFLISDFRFWISEHHSYLNAISGSTFVARRGVPYALACRCFSLKFYSHDNDKMKYIGHMTTSFVSQRDKRIDFRCAPRCPICFSLSLLLAEVFFARQRQAEAYRTHDHIIR